MNYRTTCPHCSSVFRVGAEQLDAAQGWVQCGVCGAAFEARASLLMEDGSALPATPAPAQTAEPVPVAVPPAEVTTPAEPAPDSPQAPAPANPTAPASSADEPAPAEIPVGIVQREASSTLPSIIIIDPDIPVPDDFGPMPQMGAEPASASPAPLLYPPPASRAPAGDMAAAASAPFLQAASEPLGLDAPPAPPRNRPWLWASASVLLLALLLAQGAYFLRDRLASRLPQTRPVLEHLCTLLDCTLSLPKNQWVGSCQDLAMLPRKGSAKGSPCETATPLQIVGSDLETEAGGHLRLTLTLGNRDNYAQAWPVLVLTLTDQRNAPLARRSFAPSEYLGDAERIATGMPPRSEQPLSLPLTVHGLQPMGFDLQLAY